MSVRNSSLSILAIAALATTAGAALAQDKPVYLSGPDVVKMDWNTRSLQSADIDGDGRLDLALIDNDTGKIELLIQNNPDKPQPEGRRNIRRNRWEPVLEDAKFSHDGVLMGMSGFDLAVGDLNGDGKPDLAFSGNLTSLNVIYQLPDGGWDKSWDFNNSKPMQWHGTVVIHDIDGDGRQDLAQLSTEDLLIFYQGKDGKLAAPRRYRLSAPDAHNLIFSDINGDGLPDALYLCGNDRLRRTSVRIQQKAGVFGPEIGFPMPNGSIDLIEVGRDEEGRPAFATIDGKTRMVKSFVLIMGDKAPQALNELQMRDYALGCSVKQHELYSWGDFDGDGRSDVVVADPAGARLILFRQTEQGDLEEGRSYPSLSKINSISRIPNPAGADLIAVSSASEHVAGIVSYEAPGRLGFPTPLPVDGDPLSICTGVFDNSGNPGVATLEKKGDEHFIRFYSKQDEAGWALTKSTVVTGIKRRPDSIMSARLNDDALDDIVLVTAKEASRLFLTSEEGLVETDAESPVRIGGMSGADSSRIRFFDLNGDGREEMIVASSGYLRALERDESGKLLIADQYNSVNPNADIKGACFVKLLPGESKAQILFFDDESDRLELLSFGENDGVYRSVGTYESDSLGGVMNIVLMDLGKGAGQALLFMGQERFGMIPLNSPGWKSTPFLSPYESDLNKVRYTDIRPGDLNGDGVLEIVALDGRQHLLEVLGMRDKERYESLMHFVVFEENPHANVRGASIEPRESVIADFNGDGLDDVALLVHDRVLIYTSSPEAAE